MNWKKNFRLNNQKARTDPQTVASIDDIPEAATCDQSFRITVEIVQIAERVTKTNEPCYFLNVKDDAGLSFSIVAWQAQWETLDGIVTEGGKTTFDVQVPGRGHSAFTLAG